MRESLCKKIALLLVVVVCLVGCHQTAEHGEKIKDLDFTVVRDSDLPQELRLVIEERKAEGFKMTYATEDYLYITIGYGQQNTGGYSIVVNDLYLTSNGILFDTELFGPKVGEVAQDAPSYPYIVVKIEFMDKSVIFD